jgi:MFS family permease
MRRVLIVFILLGLVSLTADIVYEGARSVGGAYVEELQGPPIASAIASAGDFLGYGLRFVSAVIASYFASSFVFWGFTVFGYAVTATAIPLLAYASSWQVATALYLAERIGKGLRTPVRDVILAEVSEGIGRGKGFGIHELMDQIGAFTGPLLVALMISFYGYGVAFLALAVPGIASVILVITAAILYPKLRSLDVSKPRISFRGLGRDFYIYILATVFLSLGYIHWMNVSYFLKLWGTLGDPEIAIAYMVAMLTDAIIAVPIGVLYDRIGFRSLYIAPASALVSTLLLIYIPIFSQLGVSISKAIAYVMATLWGITMGCFETIMRASIADLLPPEKRAIGYGVYGLVYGASWTIGSFIYAYLLQQPSSTPAIYTTTTLILSTILISRIHIEKPYTL